MHELQIAQGRFCKKLNCEGFSEFKLKFKMYIEENNIKNAQKMWDLNIEKMEIKKIQCKNLK